MKKRDFLKTSSLLVGGAIFTPLWSCKTTMKNSPLKNWAENLTYSTTNVHYPKDVVEIQDLVKSCNNVKALGSQHSFNRIADSTENQISLQKLNKVIALDKDKNTVTVEAGARYGDFVEYLDENGFALQNLASLPHITVAGACATATHGSGVKISNLSSAVSALEFINGKGELINVSKEKDGAEFFGYVVGLGALGIVTKVTLDLLPSFQMKQVVYRNLPLSQLKDNFDNIQERGYSVSFFTDWKTENINQVWIKSKAEEKEITPADLDLYGAKEASINLHPVESLSAETATEQLGVVGPWYARMPHFKMGFKPSAGKELQSEYFIPIENAYEAIKAFSELSEQIAPYLFISEIRTIQADEFWMSPCYQKTCVAIHTTWKQETEKVMELLPIIEAKLEPFKPLPHWAKLFTIAPEKLRAGYPKLADFKKLVALHDPEGKFQNEFLRTNIFS